MEMTAAGLCIAHSKASVNRGNLAAFAFVSECVSCYNSPCQQQTGFLSMTCCIYAVSISRSIHQYILSTVTACEGFVHLLHSLQRYAVPICRRKPRFMVARSVESSECVYLRRQFRLWFWLP